jgi:signal transduction histidine kinase
VSEPLLRVINLSKRIGKRMVLEDVSFTIEPGEVVGLVGRRGAGKTTLLNLLGGVYPPTFGEIRFAGKPCAFSRIQEARQLGIEIIHQKTLLAERLNVTQNIFFDREIYRFRIPWLPGLDFQDRDRMNKQAQVLLDRFDIPAHLLTRQVNMLSDDQRQVVAICHVLCQPARMILFDDTFPSLSYQRQQILLSVIRDLANQNVAIVVSSDDLKHLFSITDRILVLSGGRLIADQRTTETTPREIVEWIVGTTRQEQVTPIIWALENFHVASLQAEELRRAQMMLQESLQEKDSLNRRLIGRLQQQLTALDRLNQALQAANQRLIFEREEERKALARELHDQSIQDLLSFNYRLESAAEQNIPLGLRDELVGIRVGIRNLIGALRELCSDLRPPTIDNHGLTSAIRSLAKEWADRTGVDLNLEMDASLGRLPEAIELSVFRIIQEGLNNIQKHAAARHVHLQVARTLTASLLVRLADDGHGMPITPDLASLSSQKHFGLLGISERVALLDGTMKMESSPAGGMILQVEIPSPYPSIEG